MTFDAFISYSAKDKLTADAACATLEREGIRCWIAPRDVVPGVEWGAAIVEAIDRSRVIVLIFSTHANESPQVRREIERAVSKGIPVIPFRIEDLQPTQSLAYFMNSVHWLDALSPPLENHLARLATTLKALLQMNTAAPAAPDRTAEKGRDLGPTDGGSTAPPPSPPSRSIASPRNIAFVLAVLALALGVAAYFFCWRASGPAAPALCANEATLKSTPSTTKTEVAFRNDHGAPIRVYWITFEGKRKKYADLPQGASNRISTYLGHPWVVTDADDRCLGLYMPEAGPREYVIR